MNHVIHIDDGSSRHYYHSICGRYSSDTVGPVRKNLRESCTIRSQMHYLLRIEHPDLCKDCVARANIFDLAEVDL